MSQLMQHGSFLFIPHTQVVYTYIIILASSCRCAARVAQRSPLSLVAEAEHEVRLAHVLRAHDELLAVALGYAVGAVEAVDVCRAVAVQQIVVVDLRCTRCHLVGADGSRLLAAGDECQTAQGCY